MDKTEYVICKSYKSCHKKTCGYKYPQKHTHVRYLTITKCAQDGGVIRCETKRFRLSMAIWFPDALAG